MADLPNGGEVAPPLVSSKRKRIFFSMIHSYQFIVIS
jgi:hypothetical protein